MLRRSWERTPKLDESFLVESGYAGQGLAFEKLQGGATAGMILIDYKSAATADSKHSDSI